MKYFDRINVYVVVIGSKIHGNHDLDRQLIA